MKHPFEGSRVRLSSAICGLFSGLALASFALHAQDKPASDSTRPATVSPATSEKPAASQQDAPPQPQPQPQPPPDARGNPATAGAGQPQRGGFGGIPQNPKLIPQFDKDGDSRLNSDERKAARDFLQKQRSERRGPGGRGDFGPGNMLASQVLTQADKDQDKQINLQEFGALADAWFDKLDSETSGKLTQERFVQEFSKILPPPQGFGGRRGGNPDAAAPGQPAANNTSDPAPAAPNPPPAGTTPSTATTPSTVTTPTNVTTPPNSTAAPGSTPPARTEPAAPGQPQPQNQGRGGGRGFGGGGFSPAGFVAPGLFAAADTDKNGALERTELKATFEKWFAEWDKEKNGQLNEEKIRAGLNSALPRPSFGGPGGAGFGGRGGNQTPPKPGPKLSPAEVKSFPNLPLYEPKIVRTFFIEFENADWEKELTDFYHTDVEVPARLIVDGKTYEYVGVHFRGTSSYMAAGEGRKRSLNLDLDFVQQDQNLGGYRTLNLLNSHSDPTFLRTVLYNEIARAFIPAPKANYVRVVINGESWGIYVNAQQFNKDFMKEWFGATKAARWKMPGTQRGNGRFNYLGDDVAEYKRVYEIKTKDDPKAWNNLVSLCRTLHKTPPDQLEQALAPLLDVDGALKFLALDNTLINSDGYWVLTGDFNICQDSKGRFHIIPHDTNETFNPPNGPGFTGGIDLDPLAGSDDPNKPLMNKLMAVPSLRARYLRYVREIAEQWLDWGKLGPLVQQYQSLIEQDVQTDTRKLYATDAFSRGLTEEIQLNGFPGPSRSVGLKSFVDKRREFLLNHPEVKSASIQ